ncbi:unnamed protein product [Caenorhabditis auriculariae]|uniref:Uncharacterized protein n=1 Tax=Caenorhabditis auriculariae TaxID=2777116 RepID=A0A8S1HIY9_9PELO|nr:unnamed protein product [Caenorhabditis auriculariae]
MFSFSRPVTVEEIRKAEASREEFQWRSPSASRCRSTTTRDWSASHSELWRGWQQRELHRREHEMKIHCSFRIFGEVRRADLSIRVQKLTKPTALSDSTQPVTLFSMIVAVRVEVDFVLHLRREYVKLAQRKGSISPSAFAAGTVLLPTKPLACT